MNKIIDQIRIIITAWLPSNYPSLLGMVSVILFFLSTIFIATASFSNTALYLDTGYYLLQLMENESFFLAEPSRRTIHILQQAPVLLALKAGILSPQPLLILSALVDLLLPLILTASCWWILPPDRKAFFLFPLLHYLMGGMASWYPALVEGPPSAAYFWVLLLILLFRTESRQGLFFAVVLAIPAAWLHEVMVFLAPILSLAAWERSRRSSNLNVRLVLFGLSVWYLLITGLKLWQILNPRDPSNAHSMLSQLLGFKWLYWDGLNTTSLLAISGALLFLLVGLANLVSPTFLNRAAARKLEQIAPWILAVISVALMFILYVDTSWYGFITQFAARAQAGLVSLPLALVLLASLKWTQLKRGWQGNGQLILVMVLGVGSLGSHALGLKDWILFVRDFRWLLETHTGYIPWDTAIAALPGKAGERFSRLSGAWTNPTNSFLLSPLGQVRAVVGNWNGTPWQPFDPCIPAKLPTRYFDSTQYQNYLYLTKCSRSK